MLIGTNYKTCVCPCACMSDCASIILFSGNLACSRVAKVSVCPQALQALREQCLAFSHEKSQDLHEKAGWPRDDEPQVFPFVLFQMFQMCFSVSQQYPVQKFYVIWVLSTHPLLSAYLRALCSQSQRARCDFFYNEVSIFFPFFRTVPLKKH